MELEHMRRIPFLFLAVLTAVALAGCCNPSALGSAPNSCNQSALGAGPANSCNQNALGAGAKDCSPVYKGPACPPLFEAPGLPYPGSPACEKPVAAPICAPAPALAAAAPTGCGPFPAEAKPGEAWCCVQVQPAGVWNEVCIEPECQVCEPVPGVYETVYESVLEQDARTEWQKVDCPDTPGGDCWKLVTIPAIYRSVPREVCKVPPSVKTRVIPAKMQKVYSAPPPVWEWRKVECAPPAAAPACPAPAGSAPPPPTPAVPPVGDKVDFRK